MKRTMPDGRVADIIPILYGFRLVIGPARAVWYDDVW